MDRKMLVSIGIIIIISCIFAGCIMAFASQSEVMSQQITDPIETGNTIIVSNDWFSNLGAVTVVEFKDDPTTRCVAIHSNGIACYEKINKTVNKT